MQQRKQGKNRAHNTSFAGRQSVHSKARINWFTLGSWSVMLIMCIAFWAAIISLFM